MKIIVETHSPHALALLHEPDTIKMKMERYALARLVKKRTGVDLEKAYSEQFIGDKLVIQVRDSLLLSFLTAEQIVMSITERLEAKGLDHDKDFSLRVSL